MSKQLQDAVSFEKFIVRLKVVSFDVMFSIVKKQELFVSLVQMDASQ
jgi:hypothetical protein